jgi:conjugative relaxase-like TrwC/TraI family protein
MVGVTKIGKANANYWIEAVAEGGDDYYTKPGEAPGQWMGDLAKELGLSGEVDRAEYTAILAGKHPKTGKVLVKRPKPKTYVDASGVKRKVEPILGYDIRFSAPKSVSLLWAIGSKDVQATILQAHDHAIGEALGYLERHACFVRRGDGGTGIERGEGFISMSFLHRSSRAGDMALHSHLVTANMTRSAVDGKWLSLASPKGRTPLLIEAKTAGYIYQAALRAFITRELGLEWQQVVNGYADLAGFARDLIDHFSQRRGEIVAEMAERGTSSAAAAEVAAYRTRDAKDYGVDPDAQRADWRARADEFDFTEATIDQRLSRGKRREPQALAGPEIDGALGDLEATHSHFSRRDLLCALANRMREGSDARQLEAAIDSLLAGDRVVEIHHGEGPLGTSYFTTPRLWQMEQKILKSAREGATAGVAVADEAVLAAVLARHHYLGDEQVQMVRRLTTGGERIVTVAALPGSGKTTALKTAREVWDESAIFVGGISTPRSASNELEDQAGIPSISITKFLIRCEERIEKGKEALPHGTVVVMDESTLSPTPQFAAVIEYVERCEGKLVCVGDPRQIGAVGPGGVYGHLTNEVETIVLTEIRRQRDPVDRRIVELAHEGRGSDALDLFRARDRLIIGDTLDEVKDAMVLDWHRRFAAGEDAVMIARRRRDVADLNEGARNLLAENGSLGKASVEVGGQQFAVGDRVMTRVNTPDVSNRERWEVAGIDASQQHLLLHRIGGDERAVVVGPGYLQKRTDNNEPAIQHAYAMTTYATQSKTFDSAFSLLDSGIASEDFTVAVSRARGETTAYGVAASVWLDPDLGPAKREVPDAAHDIRLGAERVASEFAASEITARKRIEGLGELELSARREQLMKRLDAGDERSSAKERLDLLDKRIAESHSRLNDLPEKRAQLLAGSADKDELARLKSIESLTLDQVLTLEAERESVAIKVRAEARRPSGLTGVERAELALIDDRLLHERRRQIAAERIRPSKMIVEALGPRPADPKMADLWNEGIDLIYGVRQRRRLTSRTGEPLGAVPNDPARRQEHEQVLRQLRRLQQALRDEQTQALTRETPTLTR